MPGQIYRSGQNLRYVIRQVILFGGCELIRLSCLQHCSRRMSRAVPQSHIPWTDIAWPQQLNDSRDFGRELVAESYPIGCS